MSVAEGRANNMAPRVPGVETPADPLSPRHFVEVRKPVAEASNLPPWTYTSEAFFQGEIERLFRKVWNFVGRADRLAEPGSYYTIDTAGIPIVVVRGRDGEIRAFSNTCRHRGCIVARGEGKTRTFVCPYHAWTYGLDGGLISAPTEMENSIGFEMAAHALFPVRLESWGGFLFVNFDPDAPPLTDHLGNLPELLAPYACEDMALARRMEYDVRCNWKFYVENLKDAQHVATVHRNSISKYASPTKYWRAVQETSGELVSTFMSYPGSAALLKGDSGFPRIASLDDEHVGTTAPLIFPNLYISCTVDCAWYVHVEPVAVDRARIEQGALFPRAVFERDDYDEIIPKYLRRLDMTQDEDNEICALQHRGLESPFATPGRYSTKEALVHKTVNWILDRVLDPA